jgi:membrane protease YdiL (CAAX protease family)
MSPAHFWTIAGGAGWLVVAVAAFGRVLPPGGGQALGRRAGARCVVGAVFGVVMLAILLWVVVDFPVTVKALIGFVAHGGLAAFLLAYASHVDPGRDLLGLRPPRRLRDLAKGAATYVVFVPVVVAAHALNDLVAGDEIRSVERTLQESLADGGVERLLLVLNVVVAVPVYEEVLFRGLLQQGIRSQLAPALAPRQAGVLSVALASVAFTGLHEPATYVPVLVLSLILGAAWERTGRILVPIALHATHNAAVVAFQVLARTIGEAS